MENNINDLLDVSERIDIMEFLDKFDGVFAATRLMQFLESMDYKLKITISPDDSLTFWSDTFLKDIKYRLVYELFDCITNTRFTTEDRKYICLFISKNRQTIDKYIQFENVKVVINDGGHQNPYRLVHSSYQLEEYEKECEVDNFKFSLKEERALAARRGNYYRSNRTDLDPVFANGGVVSGFRNPALKIYPQTIECMHITPEYESCNCRKDSLFTFIKNSIKRYFAKRKMDKLLKIISNKAKQG